MIKYGFNEVKITILLKKNVGSAEIVNMSEVDAKDKKESESKDKLVIWSYIGRDMHLEVANVMDQYPRYNY